MTRDTAIVYAIIADRKVRYVGVTTKVLEARLSEHHSESRRLGAMGRFYRWLREYEGTCDIVKLKTLPGAIERRARGGIVPSPEANRRERYWIRHAAALGQPILNRGHTR